MTQIFSPSADTWLRLALLAGAASVAAVLLGAAGYVNSGYFTGQDVAPRQPVPFSHKHHVGGLGIDCRYCHTQVETTASAGYPATEICMTCHSQLWTGAEMLAPVRRSFTRDEPLVWTRVYDLPDYVYFDHSIHVEKGVGCETCHGKVDEMPLIRQEPSLHMQWCLDCHRNPAPNLRPADAIFSMGWSPPADDPDLGRRLMERNDIHPEQLDDCYICHR